jgi:hypothetical protein
MKYLRLSMRTEKGGTLYEKDVEAQVAFEIFVRSLVSVLVNAGTIAEGHHYTVMVVPRYRGTARKAPTLRIEDTPPPITGWIELLVEEPPPDEPVVFLTFELRIRESRLCYTLDVYAVDATSGFVSHGIEPALMGLGLLRAGEVYLPLLFVRDDDHPQFDRESVPGMQKRTDALIEFISEEAQLSFETRDPACYEGVEAVGRVDPREIAIYMRRDTFAVLAETGRRGGGEERGGMLVGEVYQRPGGAWLVEVSDFTVSEDTLSSAVQLIHTFETWRKNRAAQRERFPDKRVVGWYHTHLVDAMPPDVDGEPDEARTTKLFFSTQDAFMHRKFFPDPWYVALVLDPEGGARFFVWRGGELMPGHGFYVYDRVAQAITEQARP